MLDDYQMACLRQAVPFALALLGIAVVYARLDSVRDGIRHWFVVLHPAVFVVAFSFAVLRSPYTDEGQFQPELLVHEVLVVIGAIATIGAGVVYRGPRPVSPVVAVTLVLAVALWFLGGMTLTHDWI